MSHLSNARTFSFLILLAFAAGCGSTASQMRSEISNSALPRTSIVLVYNFTVTSDEVRQYQKFFSLKERDIQESNQTPEAIEMGHELADALADELARDIKELGINAIRATRADPRPANSVALVGHFADIQKGSRMERLIIGFGAGRSSMDVVVQVLAPARRGFRELLSFDAHSDSGRMPGAVVLGPAGLAAGATAGAAIASGTAIGGVKLYRSALVHQAKQMASEITSELSTYFSEQGWIEKK